MGCNVDRVGRALQRPVLGVIVSQFPELHETFIVRELAALQRAGIALRIYSLKRCRDQIVHPDAEALLTQVTSLAWDDARVWVAALQQCVRHPIRAVRTLGWALRYHAWPPMMLAKALVVWVQAMALARQMQRDGVTHIHAHWATMPTTAAVLASRWLHVPFSFTAHAWDIFVPNPSLVEKIRLASRVITCTEYNRRHLTALCPSAQQKITLNYHGVDLSRFHTPERERRGDVRLFLSVGRLVETKGFATLLDAYRRLHRYDNAFRAVIVGQGPLRRVLQRRIRRSGLRGIVEVRSSMPQDALRQLYAQAYAFVLPSMVARNGDCDGIPNVILEAMAMGLPVVSTTVSGIPEAVRHELTGLTVPPGNALALADALALLLASPKTAARLGADARRLVETTFDATDHMRRLVHQMQALLTSRVDPLPVRPPLHVMYVIWSLGLGGAEQVVMRLSAGLDRARAVPMIVCLNEPGPFASQAAAAGIDVVALHKRGPFDARVLFRLARLMRQRQIDVVHTHLWGANLWGRIAARVAGVPTVIATEHNVDTWKRPHHLLIDRILARWTTQLIAVSREVRHFYESHGVGLGRWRVIYNGVATTEAPSRQRGAAYAALGIGPHEPVVGWVGRLVPSKAPMVFLEAIAAVSREVPSLKALVVGEGP